MNKKLIVPIAGLLLIVIGFLFLTNQNTVDHPQSIIGDQEINTRSNSEKQTINTKYHLFTPEVLSSTASTKRVLFFYADWCPTCRPADASFRENEYAIPVDVSVIRVNYNDTATDQEENDLAKKYGVTYQHTFVQIDSAGKEVTKWNGGALDELLTNLK